MEPCIFCEIVKGRAPSYTIYQDNFVTAFLDINPVHAGHLLIVPNIHFERLDHIDDESVSNALTGAIIKLSKALIASNLCDDYTVLSDNGRLAEQDVMHAHVHIIPRRQNEAMKLYLPTDNDAAKDENLIEVINTLKQNITN